jgi:hypothetical protein
VSSLQKTVVKQSPTIPRPASRAKSSKLFHSALLFALLFVTITAKAGQTSMKFFRHSKREFLARECVTDWPRQCSRVLRIGWLSSSLISAALMLSSCSSAAPSLSIQMVNPNTNQTLTCAASDQLSRTDAAALAVAVETCARQLEANGFVRQR